ncbi:natriuretic peptides B [Lampris incognitus]|uniref:natriuretic peptides B n=1 Tax=Lampris incognitus TaxID=2546036 RepID=UPI0024B566D1|nr:natriuretic peptides B [Lampris incognitus]
MQLSTIPIYAILLLVNVQLFRAHPIIDRLTEDDVDVLKLLLHRLEESVPEQVEVPSKRPGEERNMDMATEARIQEDPIQTSLDEAAIREFLSAKNLKSVRNDSFRRSSSCFGRRMDRIGSMSSLGCNTASKYNPRRR